MKLKTKLTLSLSAIAVVLLISSIISVMEYSRMSSYVSDMIADNIHSINVARQLTDVTNEYNLDILAVIGDENLSTQPDFDADAFMSYCDSLRVSTSGKKISPLADALEYSYSAYMLTSLELQKVLESDFIDSRAWYFERLQPRFNRMRSDLDALSEETYLELTRNSATFERGFYRSIIPGIVAVGVGLLLVVMLWFFLMFYYVRPIYKMLDAISAYRLVGKKYSYDFEGDDQLHDLNEGVKEIANENLQLRKRLLNR